VRILVVDDEGIVLDSCRRILEPEGYEVTSVRSANEALVAVEREDPSLLIADIKMPGNDGFYLVQELKKGKRAVPVILMSGYSTEETIAQAEAIGASRFIAKPFTPGELVDMVMAVLQKEVIDGNDKCLGNR